MAGWAWTSSLSTINHQPSTSANMEEKINTDPFLQLLTDALRAGPGSPEWHQAVARVKAGETGQDDEYALLVQARENLASGKEYRQVRAGAGFTRTMMANIDAD